MTAFLIYTLLSLQNYRHSKVLKSSGNGDSSAFLVILRTKSEESVLMHLFYRFFA